ncbi:MAG TPA: hypothetical protein VF988_08370 [Verrucomicrobiae bacterium]
MFEQLRANALATKGMVDNQLIHMPQISGLPKIVLYGKRAKADDAPAAGGTEVNLPTRSDSLTEGNSERVSVKTFVRPKLLEQAQDSREVGGATTPNPADDLRRGSFPLGFGGHKAMTADAGVPSRIIAGVLGLTRRRAAAKVGA